MMAYDDHYMGADAAPATDRAYPSKLSGGAARALSSEVPPLMQLAGRAMAAVSQFSSRSSDVIGAGHRTADRLSGEQPPMTATDARRPEPAPLGFGGQYAELEGAVMALERELAQQGDELERMINRLTRLG